MSNESLIVFVRLLQDGVMPQSHGDWWDLSSREDVDYQAGDAVMVKLGVAMKIPDGWEAYILPRSSTYLKTGLLMVNGMGVVDNDYSGDNDEWMFMGHATRDGHISKGQRICQFRLQRNQPGLEIIQCAHLSDTNRGGFGSTGE